MWIILLIASQLFFFTLYLYFARLYFFVFVFLVYIVFFYLDKSEESGHRAWPALRGLLFWDHFTAVEYSYVNEEEFCETKDRRLYFVLINSVTNMALISGFGFYGSSILGNLDLRFALPQVLFRVPLLREILLWSGAVVKTSDLSQLKMGRSFAVAQADENLDPAIFEYAKEKNLFLVPVVIEKEDERYFVWDNFVIRKIQEWSVNRYGYPFPFFFMPRIFGNRPPKKMIVNVGSPLNPTLQKDASEFERLFRGQVRHMTGSIV